MLCDFGLARPAAGATTSTTSVATSVSHAAPEVLEGEPATQGADIWASSPPSNRSWRDPPFSRGDGHNSMAAIITRVLTQPPPDLRVHGVPPRCRRSRGAGLTTARALRIGSPAAVAERLEAVMAALAGPTKLESSFSAA